MLNGRVLAVFILVIVTMQGVSAREYTLDELTAAFCAKVFASAVFVSERGQEEALENSVFPFLRLTGRSRSELTRAAVNFVEKSVTVTINNTTRRTAKFFGDQGCVILPKGSGGVYFEPVELKSLLPGPQTQPWPMGDLEGAAVTTADVDEEKLAAALDAAFDEKSATAAFVVVYKGQVVAERYGAGAHAKSLLESWSMGKSLTAILFALLVKDEGPFRPFVPAAFAEWQGANDPRAGIRIADLFRMSSGLQFSSRSDPADTWQFANPDHSYVYSGAINVFAFSVSRPREFEHNTVGRYRNCDPLLIGYLVKQRVEARGENYLSFPQRALFDKIGIRKLVLEPDPWGNFVMTGYEYGRARDWARLGLLMVRDGVWQGERLLPEGFTQFVSTPAPAWKEPEYGGLYWVNAGGRWNLPRSAYNMAGQGGQYVFIVPGQDLVVVRMGHQSGMAHSSQSTNEALKLIMEAIR